MDSAVLLNPEIALTHSPKGRSIGVAFENMKKLKDVLIANKIFVQGYPISIGLAKSPQINPRKPLIRTGIVAGKNDSLKTIIIDCATYPGNSGGPVVEVEFNPPNGTNFKVIGLISQYVPFVATTQTQAGKTVIPTGYVLNNSGYSVVVPCDCIFEIIESHG